MVEENPGACAPTEALFIGGRSGVGKSAVGNEIHAQLSVAGVRRCVIDGDFLDMAYPSAEDHGLAERNLAAMWANYRVLGYRRLIYINTASVLGEVTDQLTAAMGDSPHVIGVLLTCTDETALRRLSQREKGSTLDAHLERSAAMAHRLNSGSRPQIRRVATDERSIIALATEIIRFAEWLPPETRARGRGVRR
ncbi:ATPase [Nocardia sp. NPDC050718]|uniref:ATPase n=1 Tax=Nocardia sp. NPDC050718 TaxID=3155788 RepID=UPI0033D9F330